MKRVTFLSIVVIIGVLIAFSIPTSYSTYIKQALTLFGVVNIVPVFINAPFEGTVEELLQSSKTQTCLFFSETENDFLIGSLYISSSGVRGDFRSEQKIRGGLPANTHLILKDDVAYTWNAFSPNGIRVPLLFNTDKSTEGTVQGDESNLTTSYTFRCAEWVEDTSKFELPSIPFIDVGS